MKMKSIFLYIIFLLIVLTSFHAFAALQEVYIYHISGKSLKLDCIKNTGKYSVSPTYKCFDEKGKGQSIRPGVDWEVVKLEKICLQHVVRDTIAACYRLVGNKTYQNYFCGDKFKFTRFQPTEEWKIISGEDKKCNVNHSRMTARRDVPKSIDISLGP